MEDNIEKSNFETDAVMSSRIRLARNIKDFSFPNMLDDENGRVLVQGIKDAVINSKEGSDYQFGFFDMDSLTRIEKQLMVEKHLISPALAAKKTAGVLISQDENVSLMINEEDHLRIQCIFPGMQIENAGESCNRVDDILEKRFEYAYSIEYGYLTCCPTNLGTGVRASIMMHLPALTMSGHIKGILEACNKLGIAVRGFYGENTEAAGNIYQISNQVTLGQSENEIISGIKNIVAQIMQRERSLRRELYKKDTVRFEDGVYRAYGILGNARIISTAESLKLISRVRMGVDMGIINNMKQGILDELILSVQPGYLQNHEGRLLPPEERDAVRAKVIREKLESGK